MKLNIRYVEEILRRILFKKKQKKTSGQRLSLTPVQKVGSLPGRDRFHLVANHTGGNPVTSIFHIDFSLSLFSRSEMCDFKIQTSYIGAKSEVMYVEASKCVCFGFEQPRSEKVYG